jgi:hypothetical protein
MEHPNAALSSGIALREYPGLIRDTIFQWKRVGLQAIVETDEKVGIMKSHIAKMEEKSIEYPFYETNCWQTSRATMKPIISLHEISPSKQPYHNPFS